MYTHEIVRMLGLPHGAALTGAAEEQQPATCRVGDERRARPGGGHIGSVGHGHRLPATTDEVPSPQVIARSVAVVGASRDPRSVGSTLLRNLVESGFTGEVHAVNPHAEEPVLGVPTYAAVSEIPGTVDLAIVAGGEAARGYERNRCP